MYTLYLGNCLQVLRNIPENSIDSIVCDPPYELGFMGKSWDASGIAYSVAMWQEALRVLKPGGHLLAFSGSRTYHRMTCAIEDAGFEIRDQILWVYGSGFPKSHDVSKAIDKEARAEREITRQATEEYRADGNVDWDSRSSSRERRDVPVNPAAKQWQGWGTALKPAHEPICVARKPLAKVLTVAANVLAHGTGALNIDGCRVGTGSGKPAPEYVPNHGNAVFGKGMGGGEWDDSKGRWPANLIHDGLTEEWARFFYCAKTSKKDRNEGLDGFTPTTTSDGRAMPADNAYQRGKTERANNHPTVKPTDLMRYLCRLVTPPGGTVLDPFMGSGSTGKAAILEGFRFVGIEMDEEYMAISRARIGAAFETTIADMI